MAATNSAVVRGADGSVIVVDPGIDSAQNRFLLRRALAAVGAGPSSIVGVLATHLHPDHIDAGPWLAAAAGAPLLLHPEDARGLVDGTASRRYGWGDGDAELWSVPAAHQHRLGRIPVITARLEPSATVPATMLPRITGVQIEVVHTPGHTGGSVCLALPSERLLLSGDTVLTRVHPGLGLGGAGKVNPVAAALGSLAALRRFDSFTCIPGHGDLLTPLGPRRRATISHITGRLAEVRRVETSLRGAGGTWAVAELLQWSSGWASLSGVRLRSALRQTAAYRELT